jgi:hypothetical protein
MAHIVALKCPNCGAFLEKGQMKCQYCGAELILLPNGSSYRFRGEHICPTCGAINERSSWFCLSCNTLLTKDIDMVRELKEKIRFEQERAKSLAPEWLKQKLSPDEYIYFLVCGSNPKIVTDKRVIMEKHGEQEYPLSDIVSVGPFHLETGFWQNKWVFEMNTFQGTVILDFSGLDFQAGKTFYDWLNVALMNHNSRKKDVRALILHLPLDKM